MLERLNVVVVCFYFGIGVYASCTLIPFDWIYIYIYFRLEARKWNWRCTFSHMPCCILSFHCNIPAVAAPNTKHLVTHTSSCKSHRAQYTFRMHSFRYYRLSRFSAHCFEIYGNVMCIQKCRGSFSNCIAQCFFSFFFIHHNELFSIVFSLATTQTISIIFLSIVN